MDTKASLHYEHMISKTGVFCLSQKALLLAVPISELVASERYDNSVYAW